LVSAEELINWYIEQAESPNSRTALSLLPTPGLSLFANLSNIAGVVLPSVRGIENFSGRTFAVAGTHLFELNANGTVVDYGGFGGNNFIVDDGLPATMVAGGTVGGTYPSQLLICSGGNLSVFSLASNTFQALTTPPANVLMVDFSDGFFIALEAGNTWSVSNPEDATTWPGLRCRRCRCSPISSWRSSLRIAALGLRTEARGGLLQLRGAPYSPLMW
jgi:hypothetical protein